MPAKEEEKLDIVQDREDDNTILGKFKHLGEQIGETLFGRKSPEKNLEVVKTDIVSEK